MEKYKVNYSKEDPNYFKINKNDNNNNGYRVLEILRKSDKNELDDTIDMRFVKDKVNKNDYRHKDDSYYNASINEKYNYFDGLNAFNINETNDVLSDKLKDDNDNKLIRNSSDENKDMTIDEFSNKYFYEANKLKFTMFRQVYNSKFKESKVNDIAGFKRLVNRMIDIALFPR